MDFGTTTTKKKSTARNVMYFLTALLITVIGVRIFIIDSFTVSGNSMAPTIVDGDYIFVNKMAYVRSEPSRNDIVVTNFREMDAKVIKRVLGIPREWIQIEGNSVNIKDSREGKAVEVRKLYNDEMLIYASSTPFTYRLDPHEYFIIGDKGIGSVDSKELGPVDIYSINGRVFGSFRLRSFSLKLF